MSPISVGNIDLHRASGLRIIISSVYFKTKPIYDLVHVWTILDFDADFEK